MKVICIGRNYADHAKELGNAVPHEPVFFLKPETAVVYPGKPVKLPTNLGEIHHELEVVVAIDGYGKDIPANMALGFVGWYTLGLDLTARAVQNELKAKGLPWEKAKAFDGSAVIGDVALPLAAGMDLRSSSIELRRNGTVVQEGRTRDMIFPVAELIAYVSQYMTLEPGDLIYTGTPSGVGPMEPGDIFEGYMDGKRLLNSAVSKG
ncbi:MAG: fumarylacetoacetate hydrolase family protein [Flavobacteriales bacterium]|nr:fumarylacetoacetate hydrolase family protein [Flavobacteriales bacterium]MBK7555562.1 fumarylacetoacetate hydrolase family protein [Flavobacteriales bacterium]MBP6573415.1 fumarylacetoacetate hydrolase family protein [Flavobacteriales bacterium]